MARFHIHDLTPFVCCNGIMTTPGLLLLLAPGAQATEDAPATPRHPAITIQTVEVADVRVFHLTMPWGPETFAAMERAGRVSPGR